MIEIFLIIIMKKILVQKDLFLLKIKFKKMISKKLYGEQKKIPILN